ncbi:MAG: PAS domain-containing sensor histidine kinase [Desulfomonilia bacterium]
MNDDLKTPEQLRNELDQARKLIAELQKTLSRHEAAEEALQEINEKYTTFFSLSDDILFSYDNNLKVLSVSPNVERITGYTQEELVGHYFDELTMIVPPEDVDEAFENAQYVLSGKTAYTPSLYRFNTKDGASRFAEVHGIPVMRDGKVVMMISLARDITRHIELEQTLREAEERYRSILQGMPEAVAVMRCSDFQFLYVNERFCTMTGYSTEELIGRTPFGLNIPVNPSEYSQFQTMIRDKEGPFRLDHLCRMKDGTICEALLTIQRMNYSGQECVIAVLSDISLLKRNEEERKNMGETLEKSRRMEAVKTLARGVAHDFNNLLTTILGYANMSMRGLSQLAMKNPDQKAIIKDLGEIRSAALRARDLIDRLLAFSRHADNDFSPLDLSSTIRDTMKMMHPLVPRNIDIHEDLSDPGEILGDALQLHQVIVNLCTNALNAMGEKGGRLEVTLRKTHLNEGPETEDMDIPPGPYARMTFRDTGHGMNPRNTSRVFEPYFTTRWKGRGSGLGMAVVFGIVRGHGGGITCTSTPGEGTAFDVYLPVVESKKAEKTALGEGSAQQKEERILNLDQELQGQKAANQTQSNLEEHTHHGKDRH